MIKKEKKTEHYKKRRTNKQQVWRTWDQTNEQTNKNKKPQKR